MYLNKRCLEKKQTLVCSFVYLCILLKYSRIKQSELKRVYI